MNATAHSLKYLDASYQAGTFRFIFRIDDHEQVITLSHSLRSGLPDRAVQKIAMHLGMCYLIDLAEICLPKHIYIFQRFPPEMLAYWINLYESVSIEKCYALKLPTSLIHAHWQTGDIKPDLEMIAPGSDQNSTALCLTGGKESLAILKTLQHQKPLLLFFLNPERSVHRTRVLEHLEGKFPTVKTISNRVTIFDLLKQQYGGLYSGVDMAHLVFNTMLYSDHCANVLIGNEYSSNFPNAIYEGSVVNHQYVKTIEFARNLNRYLHKFVIESYTYHSPFFGLYEYRIADLLFATDEYLDLWTSCNKATPEINFCSQCHKCAFTYLIARTKKPEVFLAKYFSRNLLEDVMLFRPLMDFVGEKPLDCVGDKSEVWVALERLHTLGVKSQVGGYYATNIRPSIIHEINEYTRITNSAQRVPVLMPTDLRRAFQSALDATAAPQ